MAGTSRILLVVLVVLALPAPASAAKAGVRSVSVGDASVAAGSKLVATVRVQGPQAVRLRFALAASGRRTAIGGVKVPASGPRMAKARLRVPRTLAPGSYRLIACAGARCRTLRGTIGVRARPDPAGFDVTTDAPDTGIQRIGRQGGSAFALAPDGTFYTLVVPPGALETPVPITIAPVTSASGLPFSGGLVAGVKLGPDGVEFLKPATLLIRRDDLVATVDQRVLGARGNGRQAFLSHFSRDLRDVGGLVDEHTLALPVRHFSTYVVARGTAAETSAQAARTPSDALDAAHQTMSEGLSEARSCELITGGCGSGANDDLAEALDDVKEQVIDPELEAAEQHPADIERSNEAIRAALALERERELVGNGSRGNVYDAVGKAIERASKRARELCYAGDVRWAVELLALDRQAQILTKENGADGVTAMLKCLRFEVRVSSLIAHEGNGGQVSDDRFELDATVPLTGSAEGRIEGSAPFVHRHYSTSAVTPSCTFTGTRTVDSTYYVQLWTPVSPDADPSLPGALIKGTNRSLALGVDPGEPVEFERLTCTVDGRTSSDERVNGLGWAFYWKEMLHLSDQIGGSTDRRVGPWYINEFEPGRKTSRGTMLARKVIATDEPYGNGTKTVRELWEVIHTPDRTP